MSINRIAQAIDRIHSQTTGFRVRMALETTAGQGTSIGYCFEHLRDILASCRHPEKVFVCLDTCHIFASGYDIRDLESHEKTMEKFDRVVGLKKLRLFHLNDSKKGLGCRVDRHEHIGRGEIGTSGFRWILTDPRFTTLPKIIETPKGKTQKEDRRNLKVLRDLASDLKLRP